MIHNKHTKNVYKSLEQYPFLVNKVWLTNIYKKMRLLFLELREKSLNKPYIYFDPFLRDWMHFRLKHVTLPKKK